MAHRSPPLHKRVTDGWYGARMTGKLLAVLAGAVFVVLTSLDGASAQRPANTPRTFPQFAGTWVLDEQASTGTLGMAPRIPRMLTISTTPEVLTLTERLRLRPGDNISELQVRTVRFDGTPAVRDRDSNAYEYHDTFMLVADMLVVSTKSIRRRDRNVFDLATDAFSADGDVLTLHRQLSHVEPPGQIATMGFEPNNFKHTYIYRRSTAEPSK
jgi:hypothetical protein